MPSAPEDNALKKARSSLLRLLSYRGRSRKEAEEYLQRKGFAPAVIAAVLREMEEWRYIDDRSFTNEFLESSLRRGWGPLRARFALISKGIPKTIIERAIEEYYSPEEEQALARRALEKRSSPQNEKADRSWIRRQIAYLKRRGFHDQVIIDALKAHCKYFDYYPPW
ncbi:MAG: regulatory protein RecX [Firmicutes bacterium]|nr:regulatory protein RecX [Bacillota bacterium]